MFPENLDEANQMVSSLAPRVINDLGEKTEPWFTAAAKELKNQVKWDDEGGCTTEDDKLLDGICQENFRAMENVDLLTAGVELESASKNSSMTRKKRADDRSVNTFGAAA